MGRQQRRKKVAQLNPDGTPKVKVMLAGRGGQKKAGKKAKKMKPGSAEDWMNLEPLVVRCARVQACVQVCVQVYPRARG